MLRTVFRDVIRLIRSPRWTIDRLHEIDPIYHFTGRKITHDDLTRFGDEFAVSESALIVHSEIDCSQFLEDYTALPDHYMAYDRYLEELQDIPDERYDQVIAMGVFEHVTDPSRLLKDCHRVLKPGGHLYVSASFAFSVHNGPQNYFHVSPYGMEHLLEDQDWTSVDIRGSCGPFKTVGILLQRILLQCRTRPIIRPLVALLAYAIPILDRFVITQYDHVDFSRGTTIDSMLPSNIQMIAEK